LLLCFGFGLCCLGVCLLSFGLYCLSCVLVLWGLCGFGLICYWCLPFVCFVLDVVFVFDWFGLLKFVDSLVVLDWVALGVLFGVVLRCC